jgi:hypothetical protein
MPRPCAVETRVGRYTNGLSDKDRMPRDKPVEIHVLALNSSKRETAM